MSGVDHEEPSAFAVIILLPEEVAPLPSESASDQVDADTTTFALGHRETVYGLGDVFNPAAWGVGYAAEAVGVVLAAHEGLGKIVIGIENRNNVSKRILDKLGFVGRLENRAKKDRGIGLLGYMLA